MEHPSALLGVIAVLAIGAVSPGPSFVLVARTAVSSSRSNGVAAAVGMGGGGVIFAAVALLGLQGLLLAVPSVNLVLKILGGLYLTYLGVVIWRSADQSPPAIGLTSRRTTKLKSLLLGFTTQVSNPKAAVVYASVFATFVPAEHTVALSLALVALVFVVETSWYTVVALALSAGRPRRAYLRHKAWVDRITGGAMVALGAKLASSAYQ